MPKMPQLLEGSQDLWKHRRLGESEESASCGIESVIVERDCPSKKDGMSQQKNNTVTARHGFTPLVMLCTLFFASKRVMSAGVAVRGRPKSLT